MSQSRDNVPNVPNGWKAIFDEEYKTWYYVDLKTKQSQWEPPKETGFSRPAAPPPYEQTAPHRYQPQPPQQQQPQQQPRYPGYPQQPTYPQQPVYYQQPTYPQQPVYHQQPMYQQQPQPVYYQQQPTKKSNSGMMNGLMGAGVGLLGGAMLANALDSHEQPTIVENNYYYGDDGDNFDGDDFGGGDFGGGDW